MVTGLVLMFFGLAMETILLALHASKADAHATAKSAAARTTHAKKKINKNDENISSAAKKND